MSNAGGCPPQKQLSEHDRNVLNAIFNPTEIGGDISRLGDECDADELPEQLQDPTEDDATAPPTPAMLEARRLEADAVQHSERREYERAMTLFGEAIALAGDGVGRATLYNNRAQTYRLIGNDDAAMADLDTAIQLSAGAGRTGCRALCQRGLLWRRRDNAAAARVDFARAARLGSKFARSQLIELNPYAALCNQMLHQAFQKLS